MDISNNFVHDLDELIYYYQRNMRDYMDNIHEYNQNINLYLNMINNPYSRHYINIDNQPLRNSNLRPSNPYTSHLRTSNLRNLYNVDPPNQPHTTPHTTYNNFAQRREEGEMFTFRQQGLNDVVVRPSSSQIHTATETYLYISGGEAQVCPITLDTFQEGEEVCRIRHCGHVFKHGAIQNWFRRNVRCPVCRYDIREYVPIDLSMNTTNEPSEMDESNAMDELVRELIREEMPASYRPNNNGVFRNTITNTLTNAIRSFVNNELRNVPVNDVTSELLYTFDLPLTVDASGNYQMI
jgi:hypothetical protein